jgi:Zn ribbon nucleic-acid-binding protein
MIRHHLRIQKATALLHAAKEKLRKVTAAVRADCPHACVAEMSYDLAYDNSQPRRICVSCGYEEQGSHWSGGQTWSRWNHQTAVLGNARNRSVFSVNLAQEFYEFRVPCVPVEKGSEP